MEQFDARAVMAARIAEECDPDTAAGQEGRPPPVSSSVEPPAHDGLEVPLPVASAGSPPS
jgi:hypothetical protein